MDEGSIAAVYCMMIFNLIGSHIVFLRPHPLKETITVDLLANIVVIRRRCVVFVGYGV